MAFTIYADSLVENINLPLELQLAQDGIKVPKRKIYRFYPFSQLPPAFTTGIKVID